MEEAAKKHLTDYFEVWLDEMAGWRMAHPEATLYEIEEYARTKRRELMSRALEPMVAAAQEGDVQKESVACP